MAIGENITLIKTVSSVYYIDVLGIFQHLTQEKLQKMVQLPSEEWKENDIIEDIEITKIPRVNDTKPIQWYQQIVERGGISIDSANGVKYSNSNTITNEGSITRHCNIGFLADEQIGKQGQNGVKKSFGCYFNNALSLSNIYIYQSVPSGTYYARWTMSNSVTAIHTAYIFHNSAWGDSTRDNTFNNSWDCSDYNWYINDTLMGTYISPFELPCPVSHCNLSIMFSGRLFVDEHAMNKFQKTGDDSGDLTKKDVNYALDRTTILYLEAQEYKSEFSMRVPSEKLNKKRIEFYVESTDNTGNKINFINRAVWGFVHNDTTKGGATLTDYKNITFVKNPSFNVYKILENGVDVTNSYDWSRRFTVWENNVFYNNDYYWSKINTNMYIFESYQKGLDAINTGIINNLLNGGFGVSDTVETTLTDNIVNYDCGMSETWILDEESARKLATQFNMELNDNNTNIIGDVIIGLSMYQNPIDVVVDFFDIPIKIDDFYESEYDTFSFGINVNEILPPNNESNIS